MAIQTKSAPIIPTRPALDKGWVSFTIGAGSVHPTMVAVVSTAHIILDGEEETLTGMRVFVASPSLCQQRDMIRQELETSDIPMTAHVYGGLLFEETTVTKAGTKEALLHPETGLPIKQIVIRIVNVEQSVVEQGTGLPLRKGNLKAIKAMGESTVVGIRLAKAAEAAKPDDPEEEGDMLSMPSATSAELTTPPPVAA